MQDEKKNAVSTLYSDLNETDHDSSTNQHKWEEVAGDLLNLINTWVPQYQQLSMMHWYEGVEAESQAKSITKHTRKDITNIKNTALFEHSSALQYFIFWDGKLINWGTSMASLPKLLIQTISVVKYQLGAPRHRLPFEQNALVTCIVGSSVRAASTQNICSRKTKSRLKSRQQV